MKSYMLKYQTEIIQSKHGKGSPTHFHMQSDSVNVLSECFLVRHRYVWRNLSQGTINGSCNNS